MPKLRRAEDGHWYIRARVFAAGQFGTWQVDAEGVEYLRRHGYAEGEMPTAVFNELCERNWAYTGGSGFGNQKPVDLLPAKGAEKQLKIGITETEHGWILEVLIPELPAEVFAELLRKMKHSELGKCSLRVDAEKELLPITRLWPGKGGARWPLEPHEGSYCLARVGRWPSTAAVNYLTNAIDGLDPTGTLFFGSSNLGIRSPRGLALPPDGPYYLVLGRKASQHLRIPVGVAARDIGTNNGWQASELRLDSNADESAKRWFARFGATIEEPKLELDVVSPAPKAIMVTGLPLFETGDQVVIAAQATAPRVELDQFGVVILRDGIREHEIRALRNVRPGESVYWSFSATRPGTYQVRSTKGQVVPLTFAVRGRAPDEKIEGSKLSPQPLLVRIREQAYSAFAAEGDEERIDVWIGRAEKPPTVQVDCATPLEVTWIIRGTTERRIAESGEAGELVSREVLRALVERKAITIDLDAGSFGKLSFRIAPEELRVSGSGREITRQSLYCGRWLAATIESLRQRGAKEVGVDLNVRAILGELAAYPECVSLAKLLTIPVVIVPHARALSKRIALTPPRDIGRRSFAELA